MKDNKFVPIKTTIAAAPERLLKVVKCSCKSNCDTKRCSCRKHGLAYTEGCTEGCTECRGTDCSNIELLGDGDSDLEEELGEFQITIYVTSTCFRAYKTMLGVYFKLFE